MADFFPIFATTSLRNASPGSVVLVPRHKGPKLALVTDQIVNNARSFVWITPNFPGKPPAIFEENRRDEPSVLQFTSPVRFELKHEPDKLDPTGRDYWYTPGVIVCIGEDLFIRAVPGENFYDVYKLINIRDGTVYNGEPLSQMWTFLTWELWIRDPNKLCDKVLAAFDARSNSTQS
ncbi:hypothetical protein LQG66_03530 [Bradyrhizobium ontarionense]|uniref:Uncharacterized protein n=1 Tax=Bradyrhizobium ontarionense TaxID=2898149 RepID=A0ABY3RFF3_9BRAD|nr:hypothetical protein [Bradyrhizobium sp. A19]UFZ05399.1 hypothetical protein LQG66_03530 [Bradyrhizobium sp. A19]